MESDEKNYINIYHTSLEIYVNHLCYMYINIICNKQEHLHLFTTKLFIALNVHHYVYVRCSIIIVNIEKLIILLEITNWKIYWDVPSPMEDLFKYLESYLLQCSLYFIYYYLSYKHFQLFFHRYTENDNLLLEELRQ